MKKNIVFDLDGTLLDTLEDIAISANEALRTLGFEARPIECYRYYVGEGVFKLFENIFAQDVQSHETILRAVELFEAHYATQFDRHTQPYEGIGKLLSFLQARGFKMAILSNKPDAFTKKCALKYFRTWKFEAVFGVREGVPRKPDPTAVLEICERFSALPEECFYLGDTMIDMQTANRAGMKAIGALWGFRDEAELREHHAAHLAKTPGEVIKLLAAV